MKITKIIVYGVILAGFSSAAVYGSQRKVQPFGLVSTQNTLVRVSAKDDQLILTTLSTGANAKNWSSSAINRTKLLGWANIKGQDVPLHWQLVAKKQSASPSRLEFTFRCATPNLIARSEWRAATTSGAIEHTLSIVNLGEEPVMLGRQESLSWSFRPAKGHHLQSWWVEKGAGRPSLTGVHTDPVGPNFKQTVLCQPYVADKEAYSEDWHGRDAIPWVSVYDQTAHSGWYAGVEFSGRTSIRMVSPSGPQILVSMGLAAEPKGSPDFRTIVLPGETYVLPTVFIGCYSGTVEDGCNQLKHWVDSALRPKAADSRYPLLTLNSWGSDMAINAPLAKSMISNASKLGMELFHVDAGWFRGVGDWNSNPIKFPQGIREISDNAHANGLKFGLWVGWTQGGTQPDAEDRATILNVHAPDRQSWFAKDYAADWKPADFVGADLCLANKDAAAWSLNLLTDVVGKYKVDMLEHDQRMMVDSCVRADHGHTNTRGDTAYRATLGYYGVYDDLRKKFPNLMFEDCVNGGRMVDFGAAKRVDYFSITDSYFPIANRRAFWDTSYVMPPAMCECYVMAMPTKTIPEFKNILRSGLMGWCSIMQDPGKWSPEQMAAAKQEFSIYKTLLRPLIRDGNLYHVSQRPDGKRWDGVEYVSRNSKTGVLYAFRGTTAESRHTYILQGLSAHRRYRLRFADGGQPDQILMGEQLMKGGVTVNLSDPETSQLVFVSLVSGR